MSSQRLPSSQDLLIACGEHLERSGVEEIATGFAFHEIARNAGLSPWGEGSQVPRWVGLLVDRGHLEHGKPHPGVRMPPKNVPWTDRDLQSAWNYVITDKGYGRISEIRLQRRHEATDVALGRTLPDLRVSWLTDHEVAQLGRCLKQLQSALDHEEPVTVVGAAKELVEAAAHAVLRRSGGAPTTREKLPQLVGKAAAIVDPDSEDLAKRLASIAQTLGEIRNASGAQHGGHGERAVTFAEARLAASTATAVSAYLLVEPSKPRGAAA